MYWRLVDVHKAFLQRIQETGRLFQSAANGWRSGMSERYRPIYATVRQNAKNSCLPHKRPGYRDAFLDQRFHDSRYDLVKRPLQLLAQLTFEFFLKNFSVMKKKISVIHTMDYDPGKTSTYSDKPNSSSISSSFRNSRIKKWYRVWPCFIGGSKLT